MSSASPYKIHFYIYPNGSNWNRSFIKPTTGTFSRGLTTGKQAFPIKNDILPSELSKTLNKSIKNK